jgi:hypothetical protein
VVQTTAYFCSTGAAGPGTGGGSVIPTDCAQASHSQEKHVVSALISVSACLPCGWTQVCMSGPAVLNHVQHSRIQIMLTRRREKKTVCTLDRLAESDFALRDWRWVHWRNTALYYTTKSGTTVSTTQKSHDHFMLREEIPLQSGWNKVGTPLEHRSATVFQRCSDGFPSVLQL